MTETVKVAFRQARRYELFSRIKSYADGYILWALLGFLGSLSSYLVYVFGTALDVPSDQIDLTFGGIWFLVIATATSRAFLMTSEDYWDLSAKYGEEDYKDVLKRDSSAGRMIGLLWMVAWIIGFLLVPILDSLFSFPGEDFLAAITLSIGLGNIGIFIIEREAKSSLFTGVLLIVGSYFVAMTPLPYQYMVVGFVIAIPYYITGMYLKLLVLPRTLKED